jgi:CBS domain containing-hemolysin-like protein
VAQRLNAAILGAVVPRSMKPQTGLSDTDYQELVELAFQRGSIAETEKEIILEIIQLDRRTVREVMRPRSQMECIADDLPLEEMIAVARRQRHRRLPMYDESPDTIVGVLNTRALLIDPDADLSEAVEFPSFVPEGMNLLTLLKSLQRQQRGLAIVLDEYGGTAGLVTVEDILGELLGPLRSEEETGGFVMESLGPGRWRTNGTMRLEDFRREYPDLGGLPGVDTLGGLVVARNEVVPAVGESVHWRGLKLTVVAGDERRVHEVLVEVMDRKGGRGA